MCWGHVSRTFRIDHGVRVESSLFQRPWPRCAIEPYPLIYSGNPTKNVDHLSQCYRTMESTDPQKSLHIEMSMIFINWVVFIYFFFIILFFQFSLCPLISIYLVWFVFKLRQIGHFNFFMFPKNPLHWEMKQTKEIQIYWIVCDPLSEWPIPDTTELNRTNPGYRDSNRFGLVNSTDTDCYWSCRYLPILPILSDTTDDSIAVSASIGKYRQYQYQFGLVKVRIGRSLDPPRGLSKGLA